MYVHVSVHTSVWVGGLSIRMHVYAHPPATGKGSQGVFLPHGGESETFFFRLCTSENPATAKGTTCFRNFSIGNDLFTTFLTAQMGRGKIPSLWDRIWAE